MYIQQTFGHIREDDFQCGPFRLVEDRSDETGSLVYYKCAHCHVRLRVRTDVEP